MLLINSKTESMHNKRKNGFTLAELLIVVAIIAIIVAVSIPVFTAKTEKAKKTTCLANKRSLYAEMATAYTCGDFQSLSKAFDIIYAENRNEYVCPSNGTFYWKDNGAGTGKVCCTFHDNQDESNEGDSDKEKLPDTDIEVETSYWPKESDFQKDCNLIIKAGGIFKYSDGNYYCVVEDTEVTKGQAASGPGGELYGWYKTTKISGRIVTYQSDEQKSDLQRGDICHYEGSYYVYKDGGTYAYSPEKSPEQWYKLP